LGVKGEVAQTMYIHVSKCKNNKIKGEKKKVCGALAYAIPSVKLTSSVGEDFSF
jgi:hypothetical protein